MLDIIERLSHDEMFIDAIDDAIAEIQRLRSKVENLETAQEQLEAAMDDFHQSAICDLDGIVLRMSGYQELRAAIKKVVEI